MRKDAIEFYEQRHRKSGGNYNATDDLLLDPPPASAPQQKSYSDLTKQTSSLLLQSDSKPLSPPAAEHDEPSADRRAQRWLRLKRRELELNEELAQLGEGRLADIERGQGDFGC